MGCITPSGSVSRPSGETNTTHSGKDRSYRPVRIRYIQLNMIFVCMRCLFRRACVCVCVLAVQCLKHNLHAQFMMMHHGSDSAWLIRPPDPEALLLGYSAIMDKCAPQIYVCKCRMGESPPAATAHANLHRGWKKGQRRGKYSTKCLDYPAWTALIKTGALLWNYGATNIIHGLFFSSVAFDLISEGNAICSNAISGKTTSNLINCIISEHTEPLRLISEAYRLATVEIV